MAWAKFDDGYFDHPKCSAAGKDGRALDVAGIVHAAKNLNNGIIPDHELLVVAAKAGVALKRTVRVLIDVRRWHGPNHNCDRCPECPPGHHVIHDYLDYNPSRDKKLAERQARSEAGRKGGKRSRPHNPQAETEAHASKFASQGAWQGASAELSPGLGKNGTPYPQSPPEEPTSSNGLTTPAETSDDDDQQEQAVPIDPLLGTALAILAGRDLDARQAAAHLEPIGDPVAWTNGAINRRRERHGEALRRLADDHPGIAPQALADLVEQPASGPAGAGVSTADLIRAAEAQTAERLAQQRQERPDPSLNEIGLDVARGALRPRLKLVGEV